MVGEENSLDNSLIEEDLSFKFKILVSISGELSKATSIFYVDSSATKRILPLGFDLIVPALKISS